MEEAAENSKARRAEKRTSLEAFNWNAGLRSFYDTTCGAQTFIFVSFALALGLAKERVGLIASVASFACLLQVVGLGLVNFIPDKKGFIVRLGLCEPLILVVTALATPFLPAGIRLWALAAGIFLAGAAYHVARPLVDDWLASSIPWSIRASYLSRRIQVINACTVAAVLVAGFTAERIEKSDSFRLGLALTGGAVFGALAVLALRRAPMPEQSAFTRVTWKDAREALRVRPFRNYLAGTLIINLPFMIAVPYYQVFNLKVLQMRESRIAYMTVGYLAVKLLMTGLCGRFIHRFGIRRAIWLCEPLYALYFLSYLFCTPERTWPIFAAWAMVAVADAAFSIAATIALYDAVPEGPARPAYFAIANVMTIGIFCIGGTVAMAILEALQGASVQLGPLALGQFHCFFALSFLMMIPTAFGSMFFPVREKELE